jgi:OOP family OmpA-OmpF porin
LNVARLDDYSKMQEAQIKFASAVADGQACPEEGAAFVIIMGDAFAAYAQGLSEHLGKLDQGVEVVYATGYSFGEDKCMLPVGFDKNPQRARGSLIGAVMRDGDYNICVTWAAQNGITINPDDKTYDPEAMNFRSVSMFTEADEGVIRGYSEPRDVVHGNKRTGEQVLVRQNGTATWTPGDVNVARKVGGYVAVASTLIYNGQMPATIIGNRDFMKRNPELVTGMIKALAEAGEAIKTSEAAMWQAAEIEAAVYKEETAEYWFKYAKGVLENDKLGYPIFLGGSRVNNLADNSRLFGLEGHDNLFRRVYTQFGNHNLKYYPELMDEYPEYSTVVNTRYLEEVLSSGSLARQQADTPVYTQQPIQVVVAKRSWAIEFDTGKSTIRTESLDDLEEMLNQISITNLEVEIRGHTDDVGDSTLNLRLSRERADAVRTFLMENAASNFPENRVAVRGYGEMAPIADNTTEAGRQKNRRVEVILGTN